MHEQARQSSFKQFQDKIRKLPYRHQAQALRNAHLQDKECKVN